MKTRKPLKKKMQSLVLSDAVVVLAIVICALFFISTEYKRSVRTETRNVFEVSFSNIDNTLHFIDNIAFNTINDKEITNALLEISRGGSGKYETVDALYYQLITRSLVANDAVNISVLDKFNTQYSSGSLTENFTEKEKSDISELLRSTTRSSPPVWYLRESSREMVYLRYIYASPYGEQNPAGILTISTDMRKLLVQNTDGSLKNGNLAIAYNGNILYLHNENAKNSDDFINLIKSGNGSASNTFFLKKASAFDKVEYFGYEKLHNILPAVNPAMLTAILLIILICAVTFGSTARLVHSITAPIEYLSNKMGKVEKGNFKTKINVDKFDTDTEEIYDLALRFNLMTTQIEQLVQNNYMRQIREKEYQLKALQAQINPHFLYNTLDSINWLAVGAQQPEISGMVQSLANLFREATDQEHFIIPLRQELRLLASYLTIQKIRLEDRLVIRVDVTPECMEWEIPKLSLQPIVENSIKAGAERSMKACNIIVKARIIHNRLVVSIYDNGCGISKERLAIIRNSHCANGNSIGLENIRQRVQALCKDGGDMRIYSKLGAGTVVKLIIPKRRETFDDL